jgi:hypothetical protein
MRTVLKLATMASVFALTAGSAAWAQSYSTNTGTQGSYSSNSGGYTYNPGAQGYSNYSTNPPGAYNQGTSNQGYNQGTSNQGYNQGWNSSANQGTQGYNQGWNPNANQGTQGYNQGWGSSANQGTWNSGMQGTSTPYGGQNFSQSGYNGNNITTYQEAEQELGKYGYSNIRDLRAMQGWSADAMRNGQRVHVMIGDNGLVATFPGR